MRHRLAGLVFLGLCAAQAGRADLTMRHTFTLKFASFLPPQALDAVRQQLGDRLSQGSTLELKGDRVRTAMGEMYSVADYLKGEILLVDPKTKRFATVPLAEYASKVLGSQVMPAMPPDAQRIFDNMKLDVKTSKTGKSETIQGIRTEESVLAISMEMAAGMQMRMEIHNWIASAEELKGAPALHDLASWAGRKREGLDPMEMMSKALTSLPGMGEKLRAPMQEMMKGTAGVVIRMQALTFVPAMAQMSGSGSDEPLTQVSMDLAEISTAPVADLRFEVPAGYHTAAMEDLLKDAIGTIKAAAPGGPSPVAPIRPAVLIDEDAAVRVGNGVSAPLILERQEPSYTEEARAAKIQGTVLLRLVVRADGTTGQIRVLRSLDVGLDQRAVEAVSRWRFKPGMKDGKPVAVETTLEVSFHLL
jgi:TonB family protein